MVDTRDGMESSCCTTTPSPYPTLHPHCACPCQHFLPMFSHHTQTGDTTGEKDTDVGMAVSMDTISIVTIWGRGEGWVSGGGGIKGRDKKYIYINLFLVWKDFV